MAFDPTKPARFTHSKRPVKILTYERPATGLDTIVSMDAETGQLHSHRADGTGSIGAYDLENVPEQTKFYVNLFPKDNRLLAGTIHRDIAASPCGTPNARTLEITVEDGKITQASLVSP